MTAMLAITALITEQSGVVQYENSSRLGCFQIRGVNDKMFAGECMDVPERDIERTFKRCSGWIARGVC